jgi:hypothetical protein
MLSSSEIRFSFGKTVFLDAYQNSNFSQYTSDSAAFPGRRLLMEAP